MNFLHFILFFFSSFTNINDLLGQSQKLVAANQHGQNLFDKLMLGYNRLRRPASNGPLRVRLKLRLSQIIDLVSDKFI